jgi:inositol transporter-like SP family MFS transporter
MLPDDPRTACPAVDQPDRDGRHPSPERNLLGATGPVADDLTDEFVPEHEVAVGVVERAAGRIVGRQVGFALAAALAPLGLLGSRLIFLHLFLVAAVVWWVRQGLAESKIWTEEGRREPSGQANAIGLRGIRGLFSRRVNIAALLFLGGIYLFWNTVAGQAGIFMPRVYDTAGLHSPVAQNMLQVLVWGCTVAATYFGFMRYGDRMSQRLLYVIGAALGIVGWIVLVAFTDGGVPTMLVFAILWGVSSGLGAQAFYSLWASELFATPYRASAQGVMFCVVRSFTGLLSYFFPTLLVAIGLTGVGLLLIGLLTVALIIGAVWAPETRGKTLQQIEIERYGDPATGNDGVENSARTEAAA